MRLETGPERFGDDLASSRNRVVNFTADRTGGLTALAALVLLLAVGARDGGYFPTAWGWIVLGLAWAGCMALLLVRDISLARRELVTLGGLALFVAWTAASIGWSTDVSQSIWEVERDIAYVAALAVALFVVRRRTVVHLLAGVLAATAVIAAYALHSRLFPERSPTLDPILLNQLSRPIGYPNALGLFCVIGVLLALGLAARAERDAVGGVAAALLPLLLATLYFTYSRGAWLALFAALAALVAFEKRRLRLLATLAVLAPWSALAVWMSSRQDALTSLEGTYDAIHDEGRRVALLLLVLMLISALALAALSVGERRVTVPAYVRLGWAIALTLCALAGTVSVLVYYSGPAEIVRRAYDSFRQPPPSSPVPESNLNVRIFKLSSTYRVEQWRAAWQDFEAHPWSGSGAGSFEAYWLQHRTVRQKVRDAHSLYVEVLAELGWPGLLLLCFALGTPLAAALRARASPLAAPAFGAYVAYLLHSGVDWDWELPVVTLGALLCAVALLVLARRDPDPGRVELRSRARVSVGAALVAIAALSVLGLLGNRAFSVATSAVASGDFRAGD